MTDPKRENCSHILENAITDWRSCCAIVRILKTIYPTMIAYLVDTQIMKEANIHYSDYHVDNILIWEASKDFIAAHGAIILSSDKTFEGSKYHPAYQNTQNYRDNAPFTVKSTNTNGA